MNLFEVKNYNLVLAPEAYGLIPFKKIIDRDKSKDKDKAMAELLYIYFMNDLRSDFLFIIDEDERSREIITALGLHDSIEKDKVIKDAALFYKERTKTITSQLLEDGMIAVKKVSDILRTLDPSEYDLQKFTSVLKSLPDIAKSIQDTQQLVEKELKSSKTHVGSKQKNVFEDSFNEISTE